MSGNRRRVLVPSTMDRAGTDLLDARADIETVRYPVGLSGPAFHDLLADAEGIALSVTPFGPAEMAAAPRLAVVARIGVGFDAVHILSLTARGVPLMTTGTANSTSVAEAALTMMLMLAKRHTLMDAMVRGGDWQHRFTQPPMEVDGKIVLIVGFGRIGRRTAAKCAALGMRVLVHDPLVEPGAIGAASYEAVGTLDDALPAADFVTLHCPRTSDTVGLLDQRRLGLMKAGAYLVNTARGGLVDEVALLAVLESGHLAGAGLDVFAAEPTPRDNKLLAHPGVVLAPHMAGVTAEALAAMSAVTARNILSVLDGTPLAENVVNAEVLG